MFAPALIFGIALYLNIQSSDKRLAFKLIIASLISYLISIPLALLIAALTMDYFYRLPVFKDNYPFVYIILLSIVGTILFSIGLYKIGFQAKWSILTFLVGIISLASFFLPEIDPLIHTAGIWQLSVGLAIVYAYRNSFTENQPQK